MNTSSFPRSLRGSRNNWSQVCSYHGLILLWGAFRESKPRSWWSPLKINAQSLCLTVWHVKSRRVLSCCFSWLLVTVSTFLPMQNRYFSCTRQAHVFMDSSHVFPLSFPVIIIIGLTALAMLSPSNCVLTHLIWVRPRGCSSG